MNTNRRKFFGLLGGAAVAGPAVAKEAIEKLPTGMGDFNLNPSFGDASYALIKGEGTVVGDGVDLRLREIADLKRLIAGDLSESEKEDRRRRRMERRQVLVSQHVAGLVSVSSVRKLDIYNRRIEALSLDIERSSMNSYLARLLKEVTR